MPLSRLHGTSCLHRSSTQLVALIFLLQVFPLSFELSTGKTTSSRASGHGISVTTRTLRTRDDPFRNGFQTKKLPQAVMERISQTSSQRSQGTALDPQRRLCGSETSRGQSKASLIANSLETINPSEERDAQWQLDKNQSTANVSVKKDVHGNNSCPVKCTCTRDFRFDGNGIVAVDCAGQNLTSVPLIPNSVEVLSLFNNSIAKLTCSNFRHAHNLSHLNLAMNLYHAISRCVFTSQNRLVHLNISRSLLKQLPVEIFWTQVNLRKLDLSHNELTKIEQDSFLGLSELSFLDLSHNELLYLADYTFSHLGSLQYLSLRKNKLHYRKDTFGSFSFHGLHQLQVLHLEGNEPNAPSAFGYPDVSPLVSLQLLYMDGIPVSPGASFRNLTHLQLLDISTNTYKDRFCSLGNVPKDFFANFNTTEKLSINMSFRNITDMAPELFAPLSSLLSLDISHNDFLTIRKFLQGSAGLVGSHLEFLDLSAIEPRDDEHLVSIGNDDFQFLKRTKLRTLILQKNRIFRIAPKAITDLPRSLEKLVLRSNRIQFMCFLFPMLMLINLKEFDIRDQNVYTQRYDHETLDIQRIDCGKNIVSLHGIENISEHREELEAGASGQQKVLVLPLPKSLEVLKGSDTKFAYPIPRIRFINNIRLRHVEIAENFMTEWIGPLENVPAATYLDLSKNYCMRMTPFFLHNLTSLQTLKLSQNYLGMSPGKDVPGESFSTLRKLKFLELSFNSISVLSVHAFRNNKDLEHLDLSHNFIPTFQSFLGNSSRLRCLDLTNNSLAGLSDRTCSELAEIKKTSETLTVNLVGNPLELTCGFSRFLHLVLDRPDMFQSPELLEFVLPNGTLVAYSRLGRWIPLLEKTCNTLPVLLLVLVVFFVYCGALCLLAVVYYKRWRLQYLYYIGRRRMHMGPESPDVTP